MTERDQTLQRLREIWGRHLGMPIDDVDADFFDLGGDSLLALNIASDAIDAGLIMPLTGVLRRGTLRKLAEAVAEPRLFTTS